jgi:DNA-binding response OmpR family regulator
MRILIVEDDPDARKVLGLILKLDGFEVAAVPGGREAIQFLQADKPDLILLDVIMPAMDGFELCRWLRANPNTARLPIVMLSGRADPESVTRGLEVGADEYLAKPIKPSSLTRQLHTVALRAAAKVPA